MFNEKFWLAIAFFSFLALIIKYAWPLIAKALDNKSKEIADEIAAAKEMKELAQTLLIKAEKQYKESLDYAKKLLADAESESRKFAEESKQILELEITKKTAAALERIKMEEASAISEIKNKIIASAIKNFTNEAEKNLDAKQRDYLLAQATKQLEEVKN